MSEGTTVENAMNAMEVVWQVIGTDPELDNDFVLAEADRLCVVAEVYLWQGFAAMKAHWAEIRHEMYRRGLKPLGEV